MGYRLLNHRIIRSSSIENKEWIIFLHGIGGSSAIWYKQINPLRKKYNLLLVDLPSHGKENLNLGDLEQLSFYCIADEVIKIMDSLKIEKANFIGFSLGTIVVQTINIKYQHRIKSVILAGAIENLNLFLKVGIIGLGVGMYFLPHMILYKIAAFLITPRKEDKKAREVFVREASKIDKNEFKLWYKLMIKSFSIFKDFKRDSNIKRLYIMGEYDIVFLPSILKLNEEVIIIENSGHVCNIQGWNEFNSIILNYLNINYKMKIVS